MFNKAVLLAAAGVIATVVGLYTGSNAQATGSSGCIDASKSSNLNYSWSGNDKISVSTKSGKAACKDVTVFFSGFVMPDTWDGKGWNQSAVPQTHHSSVSATFKKGHKNQKFDLKLNLDKCKNMQIDLYYAPKQDKITWTHKIGERLITAKHVKGVKCEAPKPPVKNIQVCDLKAKKVITIKETEFNSSKHSKNLDDCKVVVKHIKVCELAAKKVITIKETDFNATKHSKNLDDCKEVVVKIEVCELATKEVVTINEKDFDANKHSKDLKDCEEVPVTPEEPETPVVPETPEEPKGEGKVDEPELPTELPKTGLSASFVTLLLSAVGTYSIVYRLRK